MIDIKKEKLLSLKEATNAVPSVDGKKPNLSSMWRWIRKGVRGVHLEHVRVGRKICTTEEALERFFIASSEAPPAPREPQKTKPSGRTPAQKKKAVAAAKKRLAKNGIGGVAA